ncbi:adenosylcobinamide-phosphate synthase CbiB [Salinisphaera sp. SPP-AMP-43]|uniref:adenosylcobinamide-phosphate synthase CbiB n=1 Tax=Salinisphaera sp. SPP-AMP-43 TaxID=3121288 RepID=UPI003C6E655A
MGLSITLIAALVADALLGEPRRGHPLVAFGGLAEQAERRLNRGQRLSGLLALIALVGAPVVLIAGLITALPYGIGWVLAGGLALVAIGRHSLIEHAQAVAQPLNQGDLVAARQRLACLVSRDTSAMDALAVRRATLESVLENASDALFASVFWFALGGLLAGPAGAAAAVVMHRLVNTLDAMWGYRSPRFAAFGWAAARADDALNWLPARLTAVAFALVGNGRSALGCWHRQARTYSSPNAGPVMAAGAGALGVTLGGGARYHGVWRERAELGCGRAPETGDIQRALRLIDRALLMMLLLVVFGDGL